MVIAPGVTLIGEKVILGFVQTATENETVCAAILRELVDRGLQTTQGLLCVIDGAKGLRKALQTVFGSQVMVQRCQWHKWGNVPEYLPKNQRPTWRRRLQAAYQKATYPDTRAALPQVRSEIRLVNESAVKSLDEGLEETLTLHCLGGLHRPGHQPEDDQLPRIPELSGQAAHGQGRSLTHLAPEAALARCRPPGHRTPLAADQGIPRLAPDLPSAAGGTPGRTESRGVPRCVTS